MFNVTPKAIDILRGLLSPEDKSLRVTAAAGCSGIQYGMALADEVEPGEVVHVRDGVRFIVAPETARLLDGATIDFLDAPDGGGFVFDNPNAGGGCRSCGKSSGSC